MRSLRPRLLDAWEATALTVSLGYTDRRVQRELGFIDTRDAGACVFRLCSIQPQRGEDWEAPRTDSIWATVLRSAVSSMVYAVPWLAVFVAQTIQPEAMRLPGVVAPALSLALMFSLVASGGLVQAIARRGEFYVGLRQMGLARHAVGTLLRIGVAIIVAAALVGMCIGRYFNLFAWPVLVLGGDWFIIMSVLWVVCGICAIRQQQWRVAVAFAAGFATFGAARAAGADVLTSQFVAVSVVLATAIGQAYRLFRATDSRADQARNVPMPRLSVLIFCTVPYFWYGTVYFAFLFADRLTAGSAFAVVSKGPFGTPAQYNLGMELALLTLLVATSGVEVAGALFSRAFTEEGLRPLSGTAEPLAAVLRRHHLRALALTLSTFAVVTVIIWILGPRALQDSLTPYARTTQFAGTAGYACLAVGLLNSLVLFKTSHQWTVVRTFSTALFINLVAGYILSHALETLHAVDGLLIGAGYFAVASTLAIRRTLKRPDFAYAVS